MDKRGVQRFMLWVKMNLLLHEIKNANLANGDTLDYPRFRENGNLKQFDVVIANVPWNQDGYGEERLKKSDLRERFSYGFATQSSADWAWVQHMLASAKQNGRVGLVVDNGCLFRSGAEKTVRSKVVDKDLVECVILLPEKLFYNTGAPAAIIIFNSSKSADRKGKILFVNASNEVIPHPSVRRLNSLSRDSIAKIVDAYQKFSTLEGFSKVVELKGIVDNDYNLNVTLYVMLVEKEEKIDIAREYAELSELEKERQELTNKVREYVAEIEKAERSYAERKKPH